MTPTTLESRKTQSRKNIKQVVVNRGFLYWLPVLVLLVLLSIPFVAPYFAEDNQLEERLQRIVDDPYGDDDLQKAIQKFFAKELLSLQDLFFLAQVANSLPKELRQELLSTLAKKTTLNVENLAVMAQARDYLQALLAEEGTPNLMLGIVLWVTKGKNKVEDYFGSIARIEIEVNDKTKEFRLEATRAPGLAVIDYSIYYHPRRGWQFMPVESPDCAGENDLNDLIKELLFEVLPTPVQNFN